MGVVGFLGHMGTQRGAATNVKQATVTVVAVAFAGVLLSLHCHCTVTALSLSLLLHNGRGNLQLVAAEILVEPRTQNEAIEVLPRKLDVSSVALELRG